MKVFFKRYWVLIAVIIFLWLVIIGICLLLWTIIGG